jgi:hypothetical protein
MRIVDLVHFINLNSPRGRKRGDFAGEVSTHVWIDRTMLMKLKCQRLEDLAENVES